MAVYHGRREGVDRGLVQKGQRAVARVRGKEGRKLA